MLLYINVKHGKKPLEGVLIVKAGVDQICASRIIHWNYRLAIPSYYPKGNTMSLLLPLDFTDSGTPQAALVVQMMESGNYIGHTLLNMRHAYLNARLISSQESSWLTA